MQINTFMQYVFCHAFCNHTMFCIVQRSVYPSYMYTQIANTGTNAHCPVFASIYLKTHDTKQH